MELNTRKAKLWARNTPTIENKNCFFVVEQQNVSSLENTV